MSDTWKGVPPPKQPDHQPLSPEQEARVRVIVRLELAAASAAAVLPKDDQG